jgi:hypothetical protein
MHEVRTRSHTFERLLAANAARRGLLCKQRAVATAIARWLRIPPLPPVEAIIACEEQFGRSAVNVRELWFREARNEFEDVERASTAIFLPALSAPERSHTQFTYFS